MVFARIKETKQEEACKEGQKARAATRASHKTGENRVEAKTNENSWRWSVKGKKRKT